MQSIGCSEYTGSKRLASEYYSDALSLLPVSHWTHSRGVAHKLHIQHCMDASVKFQLISFSLLLARTYSGGVWGVSLVPRPHPTWPGNEAKAWYEGGSTNLTLSYH